MNDWFGVLAAGTELPAGAASELQERGFVVLPGAAPPDRMERLVGAYDVAMASATGDDIRVGTTSTRLTDLVNRGAEFDDLYVFPPLLEACCRVIGGPFKLSSLVARTLRPHTPAQELHVDVPRDSADWPLLRIHLDDRRFPARQRCDPLRARIAPVVGDPGGHHGRPLRRARRAGAGVRRGRFAARLRRLQVARTCREHLQWGAPLHPGRVHPRGGRAATDFGGRMRPETLGRLGALARYLLSGQAS